MQDFDQKINDENLTKCMQTLKYIKQIHNSIVSFILIYNL